MDKKALHQVSYGLYIVSSIRGGEVNGQVANTVFQVTAEPAQLAVCINKDNLTHQYIAESGLFAVSILDRETPMELIGRFGFRSGRDIDKFKDINYRLGVNKLPVVLDNTLAYLYIKVNQAVDAGSHTVFIGNLVDAEIAGKPGEPMTYAFYHQVKNGKAPKNAPTYLAQESSGEAAGAKKDKGAELEGQGRELSRYQCNICGYIYDPEEGDESSGVAPCTPFKQLPEEWVCPVCGASQDQFTRLD
ncbi:MAG: flavin reductase [Halanaerobium sp.]|nr:flavin reductase [Halanaerobium sp.]